MYQEGYVEAKDVFKISHFYLLFLNRISKLCFFNFQRCWRRATLRKITRDKNGIKKYLSTNSCPATRKDDRTHRRLTILTVSMTFTFYLSWTPYAVCSLFTIFQRSLSHLPNVIAILMAKSGTVINPILYIFLNNDVSTHAFLLSVLHRVQILTKFNH